VYENAMVVELSRAGVRVEQQKTIQVKYDGVIVGDYQDDLTVGSRVLLECKAVTQLDPVHEAQLLNYLKATGIRVGLLLNFGRTKLQHRRLVV
jgi:GxxExxY protein